MKQVYIPKPVNAALFRSTREPEKKPGDGSIQARECAQAIARMREKMGGKR